MEYVLIHLRNLQDHLLTSSSCSEINEERTSSEAVSGNDKDDAVRENIITLVDCKYSI